MPVRIDVRRTGTFFTNLSDNTAIPGVLPPRLNEDPNLYGLLREEMDLKLGCDGWKDPRYEDRFISFFDYIKKTTERGAPMRETIGADFVSNRRNIIVIAQSAFEITPMRIQAFRQNGVIFLCDKDPARTDNCYPDGHKFQRYLTLKKDGTPIDKYEKLTTDERPKAVFKTTVTSGKENIKILYAAVMDAVDSKGNFVEIKTTGCSHATWLKKRSLRHYLQLYLSGAPYIIYGRKVMGDWQFINRVDKVRTQNIPKKGVSWNKEKCFEQLFNVLNIIKSKLKHDDDALVLNLTNEGLFFEPECSKNCTFVDPEFLNHFE